MICSQYFGPVREPVSGMTCLKQGRGFTLVEMLVVVAIIGVLLALGLGGYKRAITSARMAKCMSNLHNIGIAFQQYTGDNNNFFPPMLYWDVEILKYQNSNADPTADVGTAARSDAENAAKCWQCPEDRVAYPGSFSNLIRRSYRINAYIENLSGGAPAYDGQPANSPANRLLIKNQSMLALLFENHENGSRGCGFGRHSGAVAAGPYPNYHHGQITNVLFVDSHVESINVPKMTWEKFIGNYAIPQK
ncbi:MAG: hypothetical protein B9S32_10045 [Verrucomicrobia bacterium Tous-C9LFEB]|nr:MAG: hypothetical protein B9S32_10045 [Verrucomicrobia bacterium Tous-C9LFEB]